MADEQFTRCPSCRTVFRVTAAQLEMRAGQVRCGHCRTVFDGVAHLVSLAPLAPAADDDEFDESLLSRPTMTLRRAQALDPPPPAAADDRIEPTFGAQEPRPEPPPAPEPAASPAPAKPAYDPREAYWRTMALFYGVGVPLLALLLIGQAAFHFRDAIAARWPAAAPALARACALAGCRVGAPQDIVELAITASDLQADLAHKGLLILTATLRNRSAMTVAYPHIELTLTDASDQVVVRRALAPSDYAGGTADLAAGIPGNAEVAVKLFIDASATTQAGYRLYLFYV